MRKIIVSFFLICSLLVTSMPTYASVPSNDNINSYTEKTLPLQFQYADIRAETIFFGTLTVKLHGVYSQVDNYSLLYLDYYSINSSSLYANITNSGGVLTFNISLVPNGYVYTQVIFILHTNGYLQKIVNYY